MQHPPTSEQTTIVDFVRGSRDSLLVGALAGSGKTYTIIEALRALSGSVLLAAFGKPIAEELDLRVKAIKLPKTLAIHIKTFHALGLSIITKKYPSIKVSKDANEQLVNQVAGTNISFKMRRACTRLIRTLKETTATPAPPTSDVILALGYEYDIFNAKMSDREIGLAVEAVRDMYIVSLGIERRACIDFSDMVWAPVALDMPLSTRYLTVIVDELQDISGPQMQLLLRCLVPNKGRFIGVGDIHQQIYKWRGSLGVVAWNTVREDLKAATLPLTTSFRCSVAVVKAAQRIVRELRAAPGALEGSETHCKLGELPFKLANSQSDTVHTFVLSRNNADLVDAALYLWQQRVAFRLNTGQELLDPVFDLLRHKLDTRDEPAFRRSLDEWFNTEFARAEKSNAVAYAEKIEEQKKMLLATLKYSKPSGIAKLLNEILLPNQSGILLSSVHKVKGLEADRVYLLRQTFARYQERAWRFGDEYVTVVGGEATQEELNLEYVAITRSREHVIWVDITGPDARTSPVETFVLSDDLLQFTQEELVERLQRVELMATRTQDTKLADALMDHVRAIEGLIERNVLVTEEP